MQARLVGPLQLIDGVEASAVGDHVRFVVAQEIAYLHPKVDDVAFPYVALQTVPDDRAPKAVLIG